MVLRLDQLAKNAGPSSNRGSPLLSFNSVVTKAKVSEEFRSAVQEAHLGRRWWCYECALHVSTIINWRPNTHLISSCEEEVAAQREGERKKKKRENKRAREERETFLGPKQKKKRVVTHEALTTYRTKKQKFAVQDVDKEDTYGYVLEKCYTFMTETEVASHFDVDAKSLPVKWVEVMEGEKCLRGLIIEDPNDPYRRIRLFSSLSSVLKEQVHGANHPCVLNRLLRWWSANASR